MAAGSVGQYLDRIGIPPGWQHQFDYCAYIGPRCQVSIYRTIGPLVSIAIDLIR